MVKFGLIDLQIKNESDFSKQIELQNFSMIQPIQDSHDPTYEYDLLVTLKILQTLVRVNQLGKLQ